MTGADMANVEVGLRAALVKFKTDFLKCMFGAMIVQTVAVVVLVKLL